MQPTTNLYQWFQTRGQQAALGNSVQPDISFAPSGQARGLQPYWPMQKNNLAPRLSFAYSPNVGQGFWHKLFGNGGDSVLRAGYGIYYDHFGESIVNLFDQYGSFGLSDSITNPTNVLTPDTSPRFTGSHDIPNLTGTPPQTVDYPVLSPTDPLTNGFAITQGSTARCRRPMRTWSMFRGSVSFRRDSCWRPRIWAASAVASWSKSIWRSRWIWSIRSRAGLFLGSGRALQIWIRRSNQRSRHSVFRGHVSRCGQRRGKRDPEYLQHHLALQPGQRNRRSLCARHSLLSRMRWPDRTLLASQFASMYSWASIGEATTTAAN